MIDLTKPPIIKTYTDAFDYIAATIERETGKPTTGRDVYDALPGGEFWHIPHMLDICMQINAARIVTNEHEERT